MAHSHHDGTDRFRGFRERVPTLHFIFAIALLTSGSALAQDVPNRTASSADANQPASSKSQFAGPTETGFLLPNGWHLTPAGRHIETNDLLLNILPLQDSRRAIIATSGFNEHNLALVDLHSGEILDKEMVHQSWFGLAMSKDESRLWWSGGGLGRLHRFQLEAGRSSSHASHRSNSRR